MSDELLEQIRLIRNKLDLLKLFMPAGKYADIAKDLQGEDSHHAASCYIKLIDIIENMPTTDAPTEENINTLAHLHYQHDGKHWYILKQDPEGEQLQTTGILIEDGQAILGSIPVSDMITGKIAIDMDMDFMPTPIRDILENRAPSLVQSL